MAKSRLKKGWRSCRFEQMASIVSDRVDDPQEASVDRYVGLEHLDPDSLRIRRWGAPGDVTATKLLFRKGDIIFGRRRVYQRKLAVADFDGICSAHAMVLRAKPDIVVPEFLPFFMQSDLFMDRAKEISVGSLSPTINWRTLAKEKFALPPLDEQRRVAVSLRAVDSMLDRLATVRTTAATLLRSVVDNVAVLAKEAGSLMYLQDLVEDDRPITYGILKPGSEFDGGVPVVKVRDYPDGYIAEEGLLRTDPKIDEEYSRSRLRNGDLLISIRGTVGRLAFVSKSLDGANITQDTARLSIRPEHNRHYVRAMLGSTLVQTQIKASITGLAVQGINIGELRKILIPMVGRERQQELVSEVIAIRDAIGAVEDRTDALRLVRSTMLRWIQEGNG